jgi:predicted nucleotidyltransferase
MDTGSLLEKLRSLKPRLNEMNIRRMAIFGSLKTERHKKILEEAINV